MPYEIDAFIPESERHDRNANHICCLLWRFYADQRLELLPRAELIDRERRAAAEQAAEAARIERERAEGNRPPAPPSLDPFADLPADLRKELNEAGVTKYFKAVSSRDELGRITADFMARYPSQLEARGFSPDQVDELREAMDFNI